MVGTLAATCATTDRDTGALARSALTLERPVTFEDQTLIVLVPRPRTPPLDRVPAERRLTEFDTTIAQARRVAESLGYRVEVRYGSAAQLIDLRSHAVYEALHAVSLGYIIVAPRLTPRLIRGYLPRLGLLGELSRYGQRIVWPLET